MDCSLQLRWLVIHLERFVVRAWICLCKKRKQGKEGEGQLTFCDGQLEKMLNVDERDGSINDALGQRGSQPPMVFPCDEVSGALLLTRAATLPVSFVGVMLQAN